MTQTDQNRIEQAVVDHLLDEVREAVTDRAGVRHAPPWDPKQNVRVGVLRPRFQRVAAEVPEGEDDKDAPSDASSSEPEQDAPLEVAVLGLDFCAVEAAATLELEIDISFALYQPELPTREESAQRFSQLTEDEDEIAAAEATAGEGRDEGDEGDDASEGPTPDGEPNQDEAETAAAPAPALAETASPRRQRAGVPVQNAWRRDDVRIGPLKVSVRADDEHVVLEKELTTAIGAAIAGHFASPTAARPFEEKLPRTVPLEALQTDGAYDAAIRERSDTAWTPSLPEARLTAFATELPGGTWLISVSLTNETVIHDRPFQDLALYDCGIRVTVADPGRLVAQRFHLAPTDYRYAGASDVIGHGRACVAVEAGANAVRTETLPIFTQMRIEPRASHVPKPQWSSLASDPQSMLATVSDAMRQYLDEWEEWLNTVTDSAIRAAGTEDRNDFADERRRFDLGRRCLERDPDLLNAFKLANQTFAEANVGKPYDSWRLFQLVYIVSHLPALAARRNRNDQQLREELDIADVLWFPTGGGKTEAYLGLLITAAFYDRLRGKHRGVTAWLKFPLRMLSVQQLGRVLHVLAAAERLRQTELAAAGDPFELGYLVGSGNTPNSLRWAAKWWPGFDEAVKLLKKDPQALDGNRLVAQCPLCGAKKAVGLTIDEEEYRIRHVCRSCDELLPLHITDEEIFRFQPTVIVSTVDKITGFSSANASGEWTSFNLGPRLRCPDHGYLAFGKCSAGDRCEVKPRNYVPVTGWEDPVPALMIQDEMHLIREELGAFESHYEGLIAELQRSGPSGMGSKILAATATVEQFENQLTQVYGRRARRFPSPGFERRRTFYIEETADIRRIYLGISPVGGGTAKVDVAGNVQATLLRTVQLLQDDLENASGIVESATGTRLSDDELRVLLFNYEVALAYVNSKPHGAMIRETVGRMNLRLAQDHLDEVRATVVTSEVPLPELADIIDQVEDGTLAIPRAQRLRSIIGTSVVSHGVDLERLNCMVMAGLPPTTADYIQASSRAGRTHVGIVVTVLDNFGRRESSTFTNFVSMHRFLDRLVEPVPVNKYALNAVNRTLPGIALALLWDLARDPQYSGPLDGIAQTKNLQRWWDTAAALGLADALLDRLRAVYRSHVPGVNPNSLDDRLVDAATERWTNVERGEMQKWSNESSKFLFREDVMTSLRDIDVPVRFSANRDAEIIYRALTGRESD